jgi:hypothetical protein
MLGLICSRQCLGIACSQIQERKLSSRACQRNGIAYLPPESKTDDITTLCSESALTMLQFSRHARFKAMHADKTYPHTRIYNGVNCQWGELSQ